LQHVYKTVVNYHIILKTLLLNIIKKQKNRKLAFLPKKMLKVKKILQ
jgi:hypothetical protein